MSFGTNIQFMRKMYNSMTQEELAEKMGVSRQTVSKWEMDGAFPEMEKAIALSELFNCTLDELMKENLNFGDTAYHNIRIEKKEAFRYIRYAVVSIMPEQDSIEHMKGWAKCIGIDKPDIIGWNFPVVTQEQTNVFHMHGYCAACIIPEEMKHQEYEVVQPALKYAAITIEDPFNSPFALIPNAYKTLCRYIEVNGFKMFSSRDIIECYEKTYEKSGVTYMDLFISLSD